MASEPLTMFLDVERARVDPLEQALLWDDLFPKLANKVGYDQEKPWEILGQSEYNQGFLSPKQWHLEKQRVFVA